MVRNVSNPSLAAGKGSILSKMKASFDGSRLVTSDRMPAAIFPEISIDRVRFPFLQDSSNLVHIYAFKIRLSLRHLRRLLQTEICP